MNVKRMVDYSTLSLVLTGLGIIGAIVYYTLTLRNSHNTRKIQLFMQIYEQLNSEESLISWAELANQRVTDYDEFLQKYDSSVNPAHYAKRSRIWYNYHAIGELLRMGAIDPALVYRLNLAPMVITMWENWEHIIREIRVNENAPDLHVGFEYLYRELKRMRREKGYQEYKYPSQAVP